MLKILNLYAAITCITTVCSTTVKLPLSFGYRFTDDYGTMQSREEKTEPNGSKSGFYSFVDIGGIYRRVDYVADDRGFRAIVATNEPGILSVDPAHIRILAEKEIRGPSVRSSKFLRKLSNVGNIESDFNLERNSDVDAKYFEDPLQKLKAHSNKVLKPEIPLFDFAKKQIEKQKQDDSMNTYKSNYFSPAISSLIKDLDEPKSITYDEFKPSDSGDFYEHSTIAPDEVLESENPKQHFHNNRVIRNRTKKSYVFDVHIPKGYEDYDDLPLYMDK